MYTVYIKANKKAGTKYIKINQNLLKEKDDSVLPSTYNKMIDKKAMNKYTSDLIKAIKKPGIQEHIIIYCPRASKNIVSR